MEGGGYLESLRDEAFYRDKYLVRGRAVVAVEGSEIAGVIAATPRRVRLGSTVVRGAEVGDLFVDPLHRGKGLFRRLHDGLLDILRGEGIGFLTVRPGPEAEPILRAAFGYGTLFEISEWVCALDGDGLRHLPFGRVPLVRTLLPLWRGRPSPAGAGTPQRRDSAWPLAGVVRDGEWVAGRYASCPTPYQVVEGKAGTLVLLVHREGPGSPSRGWLVDAWTGPGEEGGAFDLVSSGIASLRGQGASIAQFWSAREPRWREDPVCAALHHGGFRRFHRGKVVLWRAVAGGGLPGVPPPGGWMFRMGDTDGI
jgi:GNAT superfamily N-acetyltransferase